MKKVIYSGFLKFTAALLVVACVAVGVMLTVNVVAVESYDNNRLVYNFESDFSQTGYFNTFFYYVQTALRDAYIDAYSPDTADDNADINVQYILPDTEVAPSGYARMVTYEKETVENTEIIKIVDPKTVDVPVRLVAGGTHVLLPDDTKRVEGILSYTMERLQRIADLKNTNWFISVNGKSISNCGANSAEELKNSSCFFAVNRNSDGGISYESAGVRFYDIYMLDNISEYNLNDTLSLCVSVKEDYVSEISALWHEQEKAVRNAFINVLGLVIAAILLLVYLVCTAGKKADGSVKGSWIDSVWSELHIVISAGAVIGAAAAIAVITEWYMYRNFPLYMLRSLTALISASASAVFVVSMMSLVRKIKCGRFIKTSLVGVAAAFIYKLIKYIFEGFRKVRNIIFASLSRKTSVIFAVVLLMYTALIGLCGVLVNESGVWLFIAVIMFLGGVFLLSWRAADLEEIKKGIREVYNGNYSYDVPEIKSEDLKQTASYINEISKSIDETVAEKTKAERMKTELVTNISHDIKTPLTSIISYTQLLSEMEGLDDAAKDYIAIIASKSDRLKKLTADLFDISKVHSGNENVECERLNVSLLVEQAMAEQDDDIKSSELEFCVNIDKEMYIFADGKKMSRVLGNLLGNILKYSMKNTRVYICSSEKNGKNVLELKNISAYPMDFDESEITGRFVRGDKSRSTEGNGLGLAIAKGYTEACGGNFEIVTDGDLFKAVISFDKVLPQT